MKPYLVALTSEVDGLMENYLRTIGNLEKSIILKMVMFDKYPGNLHRFDSFPEFKDDDMVIFTDTSDVIFQQPIPELENKIYVSPELDTWGENNWWKSVLEDYSFSELDGEPIYCMGTWAMPYIEVKDLLSFMKKNQARFNGAYCSDQILFNWWLMNKTISIHPTLFGTLYSSYSKGIIKLENGIFYDEKGDAISIIHANGGQDLKKLLITRDANEN